MIRLLQNTAAVLAVAATTAMSGNAWAEPLPVAPDETIYNFEFTATAALPLSPVTLSFEFMGWDVDEELLVTVYNGLDGTGGSQLAVATFGGFPSLSVLLPGSIYPGTLDGVFSVGLALASGAAELTGFCVRSTDAQGNAATGCAVAQAVPEPASGALVLLALVLLGVVTARNAGPAALRR